MSVLLLLITFLSNRDLLSTYHTIEDYRLSKLWTLTPKVFCTHPCVFSPHLCWVLMGYFLPWIFLTDTATVCKTHSCIMCAKAWLCVLMKMIAITGCMTRLVLSVEQTSADHMHPCHLASCQNTLTFFAILCAITITLCILGSWCLSIKTLINHYNIVDILK